MFGPAPRTEPSQLTSHPSMSQHTIERPRASPPLSDATSRRAQIRAIAAGIVDVPRMGRRFHVPAGVPLQPSPRRRSHGPRRRTVAAQPRRGRTGRRIAVAALLLAQVGVLAALLTAPAFRVHTVDVTGEHLLSRDALVSAALVPQSSLFTVDADAIHQRLSTLPWVRSVTVTTKLPATVSIAVTEWQPELLLRHAGAATFVAANGATLAAVRADAGVAHGLPVLLDYRLGALQAPMPGLADMLAAAAQQWPAVFGCAVDAFVLSSTGVLSIWSNTGWQAVLGTLDSPDALAAVPAKLQMLAALRGHVDFIRPTVGYVDLENPGAPAIGGKPGEPASLKADIAGTPLPVTAPPVAVTDPSATATATATPSPTAAATATPAPTPRPTPSPFVFTLPPPSASPHR
jgi:cell division septal protein FtsQ